MNGILFVCRCGRQWGALSATGIRSKSRAHSRFQEWVAAGIFFEIWRLGLLENDGLQALDWKCQSMNGR